MKKHIVIGSRGSKLALTQAGLIKSELELTDPALAISIEIIKTSGDVNTNPLSVIGGKGVFTKELEEALVEGRVDLAVHSLKDLPTILPDGLMIGAITKREDPRDALVLSLKLKDLSASIKTLPRSATVGTSSPRRLAQLKNLRGDLVIKDVRGNIDTRLRKLDEGQFDALVLACAGLRRLGLESRISAALPASEMLPAVGQGALGLETRANDEDTIAAISKLDHKFTRLACIAERAFLRSLGGGCQLPIAAYAIVRDQRIRLDGMVADRQGQQIVKDRIVGGLVEAEQLGTTLGERLLEHGAANLLREEERSSEFKL
ncbi:MAG TPA: hydroxymethylbilane synthase [Pyrinomonadaceae bacterium]|nr:hydroxymethylbilane synthase [Pyrinomonadaceae bacterium]